MGSGLCPPTTQSHKSVIIRTMKKRTAREKLLDVTFQEVYIHGYAATSVDTILKKSGVPKGSMYHYFKSKKELVLAMVDERLFIKMDQFFRYDKQEGKSVMESVRATFAGIAKNKMLVTHGCPLYRLMVELAPVDNEFDVLLVSKTQQMKARMTRLLQIGIDIEEFDDALVAEEFASFMLSAVWGILSLSPSLSSSRIFITQSRYILDQLACYQK